MTAVCEDIEWVVGKAVLATGVFETMVAGVKTLTDPTTVTCKVRRPDGTVTSYTWAAGQVTRLSAGVFQRTIPLTAAGRWLIGMIGTGAVEGIDTQMIHVREDGFQP